MSIVCSWGWDCIYSIVFCLQELKYSKKYGCFLLLHISYQKPETKQIVDKIRTVGGARLTWFWLMQMLYFCDMWIYLYKIKTWVNNWNK